MMELVVVVCALLAIYEPALAVPFIAVVFALSAIEKEPPEDP